MADNETVIDIASTCVQEFLGFLKANPNVASIYRTAVYTLVATLDAQISQAEAVAAQLAGFIAIQDVILQSYDSIVKSLTSKLSSLPFSQFKECPGISNMVKFVNENIDLYKITLPVIGTINVRDELNDQKRRKSYLQFLQNVNASKRKFREDLLKTLDFV